MLELYRACPRCKAHVEADVGHCKACGQTLGSEPVSRGRRVVDAVLLVMVVSLAAGLLVRPQWLTRLQGGALPPAPQEWAGRRPWAHAGAEPAARVWAHRLERSMEDACSQTYARFSEPKFLAPTLNFQLLGGNLAAAKETYAIAKRNKTPIPRLLPEEVADARAAIGDREPFMTACLTAGYARIAPCERFKATLKSADASACLVPNVQQMLGSLPYRLCVEHAQVPRVKDLCAVSIIRAEAQPLPSAAAGM